MAKIFEVDDVLPLKIRIFFDTESDYYHLYKPITFPDLEPILGVKCGASLFPVAIFNPDVFPPEDDFESDNYVFFSDGSSLIKIYDLTTNTWLTSSITCDLSGFTEAERTVGYVTNSSPVADFLNGITYESREYYNIYFNNVYVGEMPTLKLVDVSKIPDTLPVPVRAGYTFGGWFNEDYTIQYFGGEVLTDDIDLYANWYLTSGPKPFEVGDVLPATTQLRISWENHSFQGGDTSYYIETDNNPIRKTLVYVFDDFPAYIEVIIRRYQPDQSITFDLYDDKYYIIDTSTWSESERTISFVDSYFNDFTWEDLNAPSGYTITFNSNGGTIIPDIEEATELPTHLPIPTKSGYTFVAWYYESDFQTRAVAGATIEEDTTLYAKWHNLGSLFTEIADAIRSKDGTSGTIRDVDFGERVKQIQGAKEEQTKTVSPTTSSQDVLPDANKVLSKVTVNAIPTETKSQQPNLSSGDQTINATSGKFMTSFTITKDTINHVASNIRSGITLYGVTGNLQPAKEEETKTVTPNFASGNEVVTPTSGKVMTQVTINKDANFIAENLKKDVTAFGITGTSYIAIELTQAQYDALSTKDSNTYYLIVEE